MQVLVLGKWYLLTNYGPALMFGSIRF